jgi:hypothetical protein
MTEKKASHIISQIKAEKYLNAIEYLQDEILKLEVKTGPDARQTGSDRRKIKTLTAIIEKIGEAAMFGNEWEEGRKAQTAAIATLLRISEPPKATAAGCRACS